MEDYYNNNGLLGPNSDISFMNYPSELAAKIKGMTFMVTTVVSRFSKGKFEQDITGILPEFANSGDKGRDQDKKKNNNPTQTVDKGRTTVVKPDEPAVMGRSSKTFSNNDPRRFDLASTTANTPVTNPQGVVDDDGSSNAAEMAKLQRQASTNKPNEGGRVVSPSGAQTYARDYAGDGNVTDFGLG